MKSNGTIWISGTHHNIFSIARILREQNFKILNVITWAKTNPPPNFSRRCFTHSCEFVVWARKSSEIPHLFNYALMREINGGRQMRDIWTLPAAKTWERLCGKHPTQKPLALLARIILASTKEHAWIFDPFAGSSTTGIAANLLHRRFLGIEKDIAFCEISKKRKREISTFSRTEKLRQKLSFPPSACAGTLPLHFEEETFPEEDLPF